MDFTYSHPLPALAHGGLRQADDIEGGEPPGQVGFHPYQRRLDAHQGTGVYG